MKTSRNSLVLRANDDGESRRIPLRRYVQARVPAPPYAEDMEDTTWQSTSSQAQTHGTLFNPTSRLASDMPTDGHLVLGDYQSSVASMFSAIRVSKARDPGAWERHDHGDEVLVVLSGACIATLRDAEGRTTERFMSKGDVLIISSGVAHHFTLHTDDVQALFVMPQTGTKEWSDSGPPAEVAR
jgi:mannose-6-phosphate isomerase-like protein (cupin superfamily)